MYVYRRSKTHVINVCHNERVLKINKISVKIKIYIYTYTYIIVHIKKKQNILSICLDIINNSR